jgi:hypothetical protein
VRLGVVAELTRKLRDIGVPEGSRFHAYLPEPAFL